MRALDISSGGGGEREAGVQRRDTQSQEPKHRASRPEAQDVLTINPDHPKCGTPLIPKN